MSEMSADAVLAANQGWELMVKMHRRPVLLLWKAEDGWEGAWEVEAVPAPDSEGFARVYARRWTEAQIVPDYNPN